MNSYLSSDGPSACARRRLSNSRCRFRATQFYDNIYMLLSFPLFVTSLMLIIAHCIRARCLVCLLVLFDPHVSSFPFCLLPPVPASSKYIYIYIYIYLFIYLFIYIFQIPSSPLGTLLHSQVYATLTVVVFYLYVISYSFFCFFTHTHSTAFHT
jgi:hypothetical protein